MSLPQVFPPADIPQAGRHRLSGSHQSGEISGPEVPCAWSLSSSFSQLVFWSMECFNHKTSQLCMARLVTGTSILRDLGDVSDTKMTSVTSSFQFLWLVQMFRLVAVSVVSSLVAGLLGSIVDDIVAGIVVGEVYGEAGVVGGTVISVVAGEDDGIGNGEVNEVGISNKSLTL